MVYGSFQSLSPSGLLIDDVAIEPDRIVIAARCRAAFSECPDCGRQSGHVHSRYERRLLDLPSLGRGVQLQITVRRFRCATSGCRRRIFAEPLGEAVAGPIRGPDWNPHRPRMIAPYMELPVTAACSSPRRAARPATCSSTAACWLRRWRHRERHFSRSRGAAFVTSAYLMETIPRPRAPHPRQGWSAGDALNRFDVAGQFARHGSATAAAIGRVGYGVS